ncbi:hypothetical protein ACQR35_07715 [Pseudarthrobacter sp. J1738]|uniref:hypothetical protein n=1 Tax=unclassified Pseudarthrobacter TaxID=2647000 RepID=UPI003D266BF5
MGRAPHTALMVILPLGLNAFLGLRVPSFWNDEIAAALVKADAGTTASAEDGCKGPRGL